MKVLITGATGFVGSHVADAMIQRGYAVRYVARATSNHQWMKNKPAECVDGSLYDADSLKAAVTGVDMVIHVAGLTAARNEAEFLKGNRDATANLLDAIKRFDPGIKRYVHISSLAVSGPSVDEAHPITEDMPMRPITAYGRTKKAAEEVVHASMNEVPSTIIRPPAVYGQRDSAILTFFQTVNRGLMPLIGFDAKKVSLVHVRDLARGIADAAESHHAIGQTYNISSDEFYTWREVSKLAGEMLGKKRLLPIHLPHALVLGIAGISGFVGKMSAKPPVLDYEKGIDMIQRYWTCSTEKARTELGYRQEVSLEEGIRETVNWYQDMGWL
ncbi:MAG: NAD-dependent epimerase/dehydratase family protein [Bacteroidetes bacterium]|nr:NAD-dependent epimerase/dehydratase family protein [Bacteroidota bacterium]